MFAVPSADAPRTVHDMLSAIFQQNTQILAENRQFHARLNAVEQRQGIIRPRAKNADEVPWPCPACKVPQKHLDSFISHVRKLAVNTVHARPSSKLTRCRWSVDDPEHRAQVARFAGDDFRSQAGDFSKHLLHYCRTLASSKPKQSTVRLQRLTGWLHSVSEEGNSAIPAEAPQISDLECSSSGGNLGCDILVASRYFSSSSSSKGPSD